MLSRNWEEGGKEKTKRKGPKDARLRFVCGTWIAHMPKGKKTPGGSAAGRGQNES